MLKLDLYDYVIGIILSIIFFIYINNNYSKYFNHIHYENNVIIFDNWSFVHLISTIIIQIIFKFSFKKMLIIVIFWEIVENIIMASFNNTKYFKEDPRDTFGDIIIAIPSFILSLIT